MVFSTSRTSGSQFKYSWGREKTKGLSRKTEEIEDIFGLTEKNIVEYVEKCNEKVVDRVNALVIQ